MAISVSKPKRIGVFGGTFDPVHRAHLQMAAELGVAFDLDEVRLLPCHIPPHRAAPGVCSTQRAEMLELALREFRQSSSGELGAFAKRLKLDRRELDRDAYSYTIDTLKDLRAELGEDLCLCLCMGMDSLASLNTWYRWESLLDYCHILVAARPGYEVPEAGPVAECLEQYLGSPDELRRRPCGSIQIATCSLLPLSATAVRDKLVQELPADELFESVRDYIAHHRLYRS